MFRICNDDIPVCLQNLFHMNNEYHNYYTRISTGQHILRNNCELFKLSYLYQAPKQWHNISESIKNSNSINQFKNRFKKFLINKNEEN